MRAARSVKILADLERRGFSDSDFMKINHNSEKIQRHVKYCLKTGEFVPGSKNEDIQKRLEHILKTVKLEQDTANIKWTHVISDALRNHPL